MLVLGDLILAAGKSLQLSAGVVNVSFRGSYTYKVCDGIELNDAAWSGRRLLADDVKHLSNIFLQEKHITDKQDSTICSTGITARLNLTEISGLESSLRSFLASMMAW